MYAFKNLKYDLYEILHLKFGIILYTHTYDYLKQVTSEYSFPLKHTFIRTTMSLEFDWFYNVEVKLNSSLWTFSLHFKKVHIKIPLTLKNGIFWNSMEFGSINKISFLNFDWFWNKHVNLHLLNLTFNLKYFFVLKLCPF